MLALDGLQSAEEPKKANERIALSAYGVRRRHRVTRYFMNGLAKNAPSSPDPERSYTREGSVENKSNCQDHEEIPHHGAYIDKGRLIL